MGGVSNRFQVLCIEVKKCEDWKHLIKLHTSFSQTSQKMRSRASKLVRLNAICFGLGSNFYAAAPSADTLKHKQVYGLKNKVCVFMFLLLVNSTLNLTLLWPWVWPYFWLKVHTILLILIFSLMLAPIMTLNWTLNLILNPWPNFSTLLWFQIQQ